MILESLLAGATLTSASLETTPTCGVELVILGVCQDAGIPHAGAHTDPAWDDYTLRRLVVSLGLIDHGSSERWLFEATPDLPEQVYRMEQIAGPARDGAYLHGVFMTHAHIGHYAGLMYLGRESISTRDVPVYAMPRMYGFLENNGPWSQLVSYDNIELELILDRQATPLNERISVTPLRVPHRDEFSETVGYRVETPEQSFLFIPDIDSWEDWDEWGYSIEDEIAQVDYAFLDATFFPSVAEAERDFSAIPHPLVRHSMERFSTLPDDERAKVHFIHFNHSNPLRNPDSPEGAEVLAGGYNFAIEGQRMCLSD